MKIWKHHHLIICLLLTASFLVLTATVFRGAFPAIASSAKELWDSFIFYLSVMFMFKLPDKTVPGSPIPQEPQIPIHEPDGGISGILPTDPGELGGNVTNFFKLFIDGGNFKGYMSVCETVLFFLVQVLPFVFLFWFCTRKYLKRAFTKHNNKYNRDTMPLKGVKRLSSVSYVPAKHYLANLIEYARQSRFPGIWLAIWLFNFNVFAVLLSLISVCLYFFVSFNFKALYFFVYNSVSLLVPAFRIIPWPFWVLLALWLIDRWRKRIALNCLNHMENKNKGFILERSICSMFVGTMGKGKTTLVTDISLSCEAIFRSKAYELMLECDLKFPSFPYINLENELKEEIDAGRVFNLASGGEWIAGRCHLFKWTIRRCEKRGIPPRHPRLLFDYDFEKYGLEYNDKKTMTYIFDALKDYVRLYLIYITTSSLILSNYSIRTDFVKEDAGNMPRWDLDFFERDARYLKQISRHSHVLDFDMLRLGKKLVENNQNANAFEFGVVSITETGKERGNQFKNLEIKDTIKQLRDTIKELEKAKADASTHREELTALVDRATQLTDKFNDSLKLIRHKCTIAGFPFARVFLDEQRPESLGADARDLCEIVHIKDKTETKLAMPFFFIAELFYAFTFGRFRRTYETYRFNRGDNTLLMFTLKKICASLHQYYTRIYNRFGYHVRTLAVEDGATGEVTKEGKYYLSTKKIYSNRFSTDAYGDIFARGLRTVGVGMNELPEYATHKATEAELLTQNSYFINEITKYGKGGGSG